MDWIIPLLVIDKVPRSQRAAVAEQLLPVALPGSSSQRLAVAAITAEQQVKRQTLADRNLVEEVVKVVAIPDAVALAEQCPEHHRVFTKLPPEIQAQIFDSNSSRPGVSGVSKAVHGKARLVHPSKS